PGAVAGLLRPGSHRGPRRFLCAVRALAALAPAPPQAAARSWRGALGSGASRGPDHRRPDRPLAGGRGLTRARRAHRLAGPDTLGGALGGLPRRRAGPRAGKLTWRGEARDGPPRARPG